MRTQLTPEQRAERLEAALADVAAAVERRSSGEDWRAWLALTGPLNRRHRYSARNTMAVATSHAPQYRPVHTRRLPLVADPRPPGPPRGTRLSSPRPRHPYRRRPQPPDNSDRKRRAVIGLRIESVFDLTQTEDDGPTEPPAMVMPTGEGPTGAWDALTGLLTAHGWNVQRQAIAGETQGYTEWGTRRVVVRPDLTPAPAAYVLAHETAHVWLHERSDLPRPVKEVEADSVAYLVTDAISLNASTATFPYITGWSNGDHATVLTVAGRVIDAATAILDALTPTTPPARYFPDRPFPTCRSRSGAPRDPLPHPHRHLPRPARHPLARPSGRSHRTSARLPLHRGRLARRARPVRHLGVATTRHGRPVYPARFSRPRRVLGLGKGLGRSAPISRTIGRLVAYDAIDRDGTTLAGHLALPDLPERVTRNLSYSARLAHEHHTHDRPTPRVA
jgi:hypothetical protein